MQRITNLTCHLNRETPADHRLNDVMQHLLLASKTISADINKAGLTDILGSAGSENTTGDAQQTLDVQADHIFTEILSQSPHVVAVGTEESEDIIPFDDEYHANGDYIVFMDPVDGSSNIDVNVSIGTNFAIFKKPAEQTISEMIEARSYLQKGRSVVAAGYIVYGASTMLVYSMGDGVHGFTLDPAIGEYVLSHTNITIPNTLKYFSVNESYREEWTPEIQEYVQSFYFHPDKPSGRYIGSLVSDFHRNMLKGGVFMYPSNEKHPKGKLRLLYEGVPFAYLAEQAGGTATDGIQPILDIQPTELHQRCELYIGNSSAVYSSSD